MWIEIGYMENSAPNVLSLPLRECGLKYARAAAGHGYFKSLPLRECGLKFIMICIGQARHKVTPLAGVWIEIAAW